jgi:predicted ester cyclase
MSENKALIAAYLKALSGQPKTQVTVDRYVSDAALSKHIADVEAAFPQYELLALDTIEEGDRVAVRASFRGIHRGTFAGIAATGRKVEAGLIIVYRIESGKIAEHWMQFDLYSLLQQLA